MMDGMMAGMGLWALVVIITVLAVLALAVLGSVWLWRRLRDDHAQISTGDDDGDAARDMLRKRYAAGEIDDEEYERRLSALTWR
ncbi:MAG: SHOCT domain-containing protein [Pseudonocardia sp.]